MGASNFHTVNAQAVYVIDYGDDEFMWQESQDHLGNWIKELDSSFTLDDLIKSEKELRSYPSSPVGYWENELTFLNLTFDFRINLFIRSGYYEAACLDYEIEWFADGDYYEDVDSVINSINDYLDDYNIKPGLWALHKFNLETKLTDLQDQLIKHVESILPQVSTPYGVVAQFSNGETLYEEL